MRTRELHFVLILTATLGVAGCGPKSGGNATDSTVGATAHAMADMPGMASGSTAAVDQMQSHMRMMEGATADSMKAMLPMHRQMLGDALSQMDRDMSGMNMAGDAGWKALTDSLRQDIARFADMPAPQLATFMPAHHARVRRLVDMHNAMMGKK